MIAHDGHIRELPKRLDESKVADHTIVAYSSDNGAQASRCPDGATTPYFRRG